MTSLVQQKFGEVAADYAASAVHAKGPSLARLIDLVDPKPAWRALDIATGAGHTALAFAPRVAKVTASDVTEAMLVEAKKLAAARGVANFRTARARAEDLPFPDMSFDLVTCRLAAHHFEDASAFLVEAARVLMPGGAFALVDNVSPDRAILPQHSPGELRDWAVVYNDFEKLRDPSHGRCLGLAEWTDLLKSAGLTAAHSEHMDQDIEFGPWVQRMRCAESTIVRLKAMLANEPLASFLKPRETDAGLVFTLQEAIVVARKPA